MSKELAQISFYLARAGCTFESVIKAANLPKEGENFKVRSLHLDEAEVKFFCIQSKTSKANPPWLDFINEKIEPEEERINFNTLSIRPSGLLLIKINDRIFSATFGMKGASLLDKSKFISDFGIKTAMNMCGNTVLRQTKSRTHAINTQNIDRQLSQPSESFEFGLGESEFLKYISAQIEGESKVTLQGKDNLTIKIIGENKLSWDRIIYYCTKFLEQYENESYRSSFPNYPNFLDIDEEKIQILDSIIIENIKKQDFSRIHLSIPEFISDDEFSFSYSNYYKKENIIFSYIHIDNLKNKSLFNLQKLDIKNLKAKFVYAYSHLEDRILGYRKWNLYDCIVAEQEINGEYFILSGGEWRKIDNDFYTSINNFIENVLIERPISEKYFNIDISDIKKMQNREDIFNQSYCNMNDNTILFDKSKLKIAQSQRDKEFCDILELSPGGLANIIHVKKYIGSSSINYLFSQARFYCEFFLSDEIFLSEIRGHIDQSGHKRKDAFLDHIKADLADVSGKDYEVSLWILYDGAKKAPQKSDLPLMAKYEIKLTYDRLRNIDKFSSVCVSMIPVKMVNFQISKKNS